ncbi:MAG: class I SAM-dependent methyltransferase, partial [Anaerolineae bacterium]|nr:class I SAM-dependent methyltransferase [Anaerolineae bacterium]
MSSPTSLSVAPPVEFYDALAPMFDVMTDWDARLAVEGPFLCAQLEAAGARRVLDFACGSGGHALWLAERGYTVVGVDISPAMIRLARQKAQARGAAVSFAVIEPGEAPAVAGAPFDAVICLGNSLPHLLTQDALTAALRAMARVLRGDGVLILQNLNYDLRWEKQPRWFAAQGGELAGQSVLVWRFADYDVPAGRIYFHIALFRRMGVEWTVEVHTTPQRPLFRADLLAALAAAGFERVQTFGRMALPVEPFDAGCSGDLVVV